jgi:hypothetical protein
LEAAASSPVSTRSPAAPTSPLFGDAMVPQESIGNRPDRIERRVRSALPLINLYGPNVEWRRRPE